MEFLREFFKTEWGKRVAVGVAALAALCVLFSLRGLFSGSSGAAASAERMYICAETGKGFKHELKRGEQVPVHSPHSGKDTGYPAELCYWTSDGQVKKSPDPVLLKALLGQRGPTFCPVCGRLVVGHNPVPSAGDTPPPTEAEYAARRGNRGAGGTAVASPSAPAAPAPVTDPPPEERDERDER